MAAHSRRARLGLMVGGIHYRQPGLWLKAATTLDVLSGGRAWFGIGAAWNEEESRGLGFPMPPLATASSCSRTPCAACMTMAGAASAGTEAAFEGRTVQATRLLNSPRRSAGRTRRSWWAAVVSSRRSDSWRATPTPATCSAAPSRSPTSTRCSDGHCEAEGRDYDAIERTNLTSVSITPDGARLAHPVDALWIASGAGPTPASQHTIFSVRDVWDPAKLELIGAMVLPQLRGIGEPSPVA